MTSEIRPRRLSHVRSLFLRPPPEGTVPASGAQANRVSFLDLDEDSDDESPLRILHHHLFSRSSPFLPEDSPTRQRRRSIIPPAMNIGFGTLGRRSKDAPPPLDLSHSPPRSSAAPSAQPSPPPDMASSSKPPSSRAALLRLSIRRADSSGSIRTLGIRSRPRDRSSLESTSSSIDTFESDTDRSIASSADTSYSLHFPEVKPVELEDGVDLTTRPPSPPLVSEVSYSPRTARAPLPYDVDLLQMEIANHELLELLRPKDSPSFIEFEKPPRSILDLGAGLQRWDKAVFAKWPSAKITHMNITDNWVYFRGEIDTPGERVVHQVLPFKDGEFDYVRLSGHTFSIPNASWPWVLSEIHRVLRRGGRLEIIEDELVFPMAPPAADCAPDPPPAWDAYEDDEDDDDSIFSLDSETTVRSSRAIRPAVSAAASASLDRAEQYADMRKHCADMETLFSAALDARDLLPARGQLSKMLGRAFGERAMATHAPIEVHLPSRAFIEAAHAHADTDPLLGAALGLGGARSKAGRMLGCARDDVFALEDRARASRIGASSKAARMLGLPAAPTAGTYVPPGLIALRPGEPPRLLALPPRVLEAHATRFPRALTAHERELELLFAGHAGEDGAPTLNACDMADSVWEYHTLHRRRLGMPLADPGDALCDDFAALAPAPAPHAPVLEPPPLTRAPSVLVRPRSSAIPLLLPPAHGVALSSALPPGEGLTRVRSFRVYAATKA